MKPIIISVFACISFLGKAQQKFEKEVGINGSDAPEIAVQFVEKLELSKKIKWYKETGIKSVSYEAKTKHNSRRLSIEFSEDGTFEDLEVTADDKEIPAAKLTKIEDYLCKAHTKFKFDKVQIQYLGNFENIKALTDDFKKTEGLTVNYEFVISTKEESTFVLYEYLFNAQGEFMSRARIIQKMTDNIEY